MTTPLRFTSADLESFPDDGKRYEIIDGKLYVSRQPHLHHQRVCSRILLKLQLSSERGEGEAVFASGLIFADDDDVAPDVVWLSSCRLAATLGPDGPKVSLNAIRFFKQNLFPPIETRLSSKAAPGSG